jgi:hypothetical protein
MSELFKSTHYLRFSNRGTAVETIVVNSRFSVNLPACLRGLGRSRITVHDALINFATVEEIDETMEIYCESNIPINQSIDTETLANGNFDGQVYNKLVTFQTDNREYLNRLRPNAFIEFDSESIPERIEWGLFKRVGNGSNVLPIPADAGHNNTYFFCTLKIEVYK